MNLNASVWVFLFLFIMLIWNNKSGKLQLRCGFRDWKFWLSCIFLNSNFMCLDFRFSLFLLLCWFEKIKPVSNNVIWNSLKKMWYEIERLKILINIRYWLHLRLHRRKCPGMLSISWWKCIRSPYWGIGFLPMMGARVCLLLVHYPLLRRFLWLTWLMRTKDPLLVLTREFSVNQLLILMDTTFNVFYDPI